MQVILAQGTPVVAKEHQGDFAGNPCYNPGEGQVAFIRSFKCKIRQNTIYCQSGHKQPPFSSIRPSRTAACLGVGIAAARAGFAKSRAIAPLRLMR